MAMVIFERKSSLFFQKRLNYFMFNFWKTQLKVSENVKKIRESKKTGNYPEKIQMSDDVYFFSTHQELSVIKNLKINS
jgi:hypothetical protein